ncbi:histidine phosphatase family protein [Exiguobacterium mexicanum]|uniref:Histidine phosphatase family protein n=1 Tax=Exiguobacterium mexicanum TaxID=340146 RepID=A0ABT7ML59_9BACL|nr:MULTISPECIES: histidine phosphatase family protein [Exiguobacterium]MDL5376145.1 histidine phosphatase family protein [Exiguobacterium mexicanum]
MTTLYFVRHAHSTYTADEWTRPLSEKGERDVRNITNTLSEEKIDLVVSSPYKRAIQTVQGIADQIGTEVLLMDDLRERMLTTEPAENFTLAMTRVWEDPTFAWEGGESNVVAQQRGVRAIQSLLDQYEGKRIAIGTHGNIMVLILNYFDGQYGYTFWKELDMPDVYKVTFNQQELLSVEKLWDRQGVV